MLYFQLQLLKYLRNNSKLIYTYMILTFNVPWHRSVYILHAWSQIRSIQVLILFLLIVLYYA